MDFYYFGEFNSKMVYSYFKDYLKKIDIYDVNGFLIKSDVFDYNDMDMIKEWRECQMSGDIMKVPQRIRYNYDENGNLVKKTFLNYGQEWQSFVYHYDDRGLMTGGDILFIDKSIFLSYNFYYDGSDKLIRYESMAPEGVYDITTFEYDKDSGSLNVKEQKLREENYAVYTTVYVYDDINNLNIFNQYKTVKNKKMLYKIGQYMYSFWQ